MGLYIGSTKVKVSTEDGNFKANFYSSTPITNGTPLISYDNYMLKDLNGLYLTVKEDE